MLIRRTFDSSVVQIYVHLELVWPSVTGKLMFDWNSWRECHRSFVLERKFIWCSLSENVKRHNWSFNFRNYWKFVDDPTEKVISSDRKIFQLHNKRVRDCLDETYSNRWTGRRGTLFDCPQRSPDLVPSNFFSVGAFKLCKIQDAIKFYWRTQTANYWML